MWLQIVPSNVLNLNLNLNVFHAKLVRRGEHLEKQQLELANGKKVKGQKVKR